MNIQAVCVWPGSAFGLRSVWVPSMNSYLKKIRCSRDFIDFKIYFAKFKTVMEDLKKIGIPTKTIFFFINLFKKIQPFQYFLILLFYTYESAFSHCFLSF